jgi:uncharacterized membrane protein
VPVIGWLAVQVAAGVVLAGFYQILNRVTNEGRGVIDDALQIKEFGGQLVLATVVRNIITGIGYCFLVIPGIYFSVSYILTERFLVTERLSYWNALERSRKLITEKWFSMFGFCLLLVGLNILGALALGIGLVITIPTTICALYLAHKDIMAQLTSPTTGSAL